MTAAASISAIIPLYNKAETIQRAIASIRSQTRPATEILVIDDGSTDDGPRRVLDAADPPVRVVTQVNGGPASARNAGLALATGTYVAFLDADDEWHPDFLASALTYLEDPDLRVAFVATSYYESTHRGSLLRQETLGLSGPYTVTPTTPVELLDRLETFISLGFTVMRTDLARVRGGYFDLVRCHYGEDAYLALKLIVSETFFIIPNPLGTYHREDSDLHGNGLAAIPALLPVFTHFEALLDAVPKANRGLVADFVSLRAFRAAQMYAKLGERGTAQTLLRAFPNGSRRRGELARTKLLVLLAPAMPRVRRYRRAAGLDRLWRSGRAE